MLVAGRKPENFDSMAKLLVVFCQVFFLVLGCYMIYWLVSEIKGKTVNKDVIASMNLYCIMIMFIFAAV